MFPLLRPQQRKSLTFLSLLPTIFFFWILLKSTKQVIRRNHGTSMKKEDPKNKVGDLIRVLNDFCLCVYGNFLYLKLNHMAGNICRV